MMWYFCRGAVLEKVRREEAERQKFIRFRSISIIVERKVLNPELSPSVDVKVASRTQS